MKVSRPDGQRKNTPYLISGKWLACAALWMSGFFQASGQGAAVLPEYIASRQVEGNLRSWGSTQMGPLLKLWEEGFRTFQPGVTFTDNLLGTATAQYGLHEWVADLAVSTRQIYPYEYYGLYRRSLMYPVEIAVASGSFDVPSKSFALGVFVNKTNPLAKLTLAQLDGIFGAHRTGGWQRLSWHSEVARGAEKDLRTWGQLGLTGEWADRPIHVYGPPGIYPGGISFFQTRVMGGADSWNEHLIEFADRQKMMQTLNEDPYGIAYTCICYATSATKSLAIAASSIGPYIPLTRASVEDRSYPLSRFAYIYFAPDRPDGTVADPAVDPKVEEFLKYILSRQGQTQVVREGDYLPLRADETVKQRRELVRKHSPEHP